jgi:hypothetical protein
MLENTEGVMQKDNREKLATLGTQDTGQIHLFVLCLVYPMLPVSLDCPFYYPYGKVASFSRLSFCITPSVFSNIYLSCFLCTLCCGQSRETGNIGYTRHRTNKC